MTRYLDVQVLEVIAPGPDAQIGVQIGGDGSSYTVLSCVGMNYAPQVGDIVRVDMDSVPGQPMPWRCMTPGRTFQPQTVSLAFAAAAPSDPNFLATSTVYVKAGALYATLASAPTPSTAGKIVVPPIDSGTWDATNGTRQGLLRQGVFPGPNGAACTGYWLYDTSKFAAAAGKTITGISVAIGRASGIGDPYAPKGIRLVEHALTGPPAAQPAVFKPTATDIELGATDTVLPFAVELAYATDLIAGTATGLGIASGSYSDYLAVLGNAGSGAITITWSS